LIKQFHEERPPRFRPRPQINQRMSPVVEIRTGTTKSFNPGFCTQPDNIEH
jgi:hypothetical protein